MGGGEEVGRSRAAEGQVALSLAAISWRHHTTSRRCCSSVVLTPRGGCATGAAASCVTRARRAACRSRASACHSRSASAIGATWCAPRSSPNGHRRCGAAENAFALGAGRRATCRCSTADHRDTHRPLLPFRPSWPFQIHCPMATCRVAPLARPQRHQRVEMPTARFLNAPGSLLPGVSCLR